jgi:hypothetical protein
MTTQIIEVYFFFIKIFFAQFSHLTASLVGASVIGHGIMEGNIAH